MYYNPSTHQVTCYQLTQQNIPENWGLHLLYVSGVIYNSVITENIYMT